MQTSNKSLSKFIIAPFSEIKTASDGLSQIRRNGFGEYSLEDLKNQIKDGKAINEKFNFSNSSNSGEHYFEIYTDSKHINLSFVVYGINYGLFDEETEAKKRKDNDDNSKFFDVTRQDVNDHAVSIGLPKKQIIADITLRWDWEINDFKCRLTARIDHLSTPHSFIFTCEYAIIK